ncbi:pantoate--beta-alanine ligase [Pontibacillus salicampi]|uniref:Pantothenate synthetase n=1 Tax=Pontibacillus salicampi TaxID=1449801 RepID=A0ABV6LLB3_9BACI
MRIINSLSEMQHYVQEQKKQGLSIGFVPTMGYLHEGHLQLMDAAREENDLLVASIFVNPLQFGPNEDFEQYPRDEEEDIRKARERGVDVLFFPHVHDMYPSSLSIVMKVERRADVLCGRSREGHFDGVVTVLAKLFHLVQPNKAYFGNKDAQQVAVVDALIEDYNFPIELRALNTVREKDGLAKSSRNVYLSKEEREEAPYIYEALHYGKRRLQEEHVSSRQVKDEVSRFITSHTRGKIDYVDILSYPQLERVEEYSGQIIIAAAVYFSKARLIDNIIFEVRS